MIQRGESEIQRGDRANGYLWDYDTEERYRANGYLWDYDTEESQSERVSVGL